MKVCIILTLKVGFEKFACLKNWMVNPELKCSLSCAICSKLCFMWENVRGGGGDMNNVDIHQFEYFLLDISHQKLNHQVS